MVLKDYLLVFVTVTLWGLNAVFVRFGLGEIPPFLMTALRLLITALILFPFIDKTPKEMKKNLIIISFLLGIGHFGLANFGFAKVDSGTAATLIQLGVPFSTIIATIFLKDKLGFLPTMGLIISFLGVYIISGGRGNIESPIHIFAIIISALSWAIANIFIKKLKDVSPFQINFHVGFYACPFMFLFSFLAKEGNPIAIITNSDWHGFVSVFYSAVISAIIANSLWYKLLSKNNINNIVFFSLLTPVSSFVGGFLILHEPILALKIIGALIIILGIVVAEFRKIGFRKIYQEPS